MSLAPPINAQRLWSRVEALAGFTDAGTPWTRRAFTPLHLRSREWLRDQFAAAGMHVSLDAGGNLVGRIEGTGPTAAPPLVTGSHCDTVPSGGRFDGIIGVLAGIEVAHALRESGAALSRPLEVIDFLSEEPSEYGISCVGSRAIAGQLSPAMLEARSPDGETLAQGLRRIGGDPDALHRPLRDAGSVAAFVELHIEQGPVLESRNLPIGVVTNIVGIRRYVIVVEGRPDHAGTTPMHLRSDALAGAARIISAAQEQALRLDGQPHYVVATVGRLSLTPNASNAVPGRVEMVLEVRSDSTGVLAQFADALMSSVGADLARLRVKADVQQVSESKPTDCSPLVMDAIDAAAAALRYPTMRLPSGAGHDAVYMAAAAPMGMIFIPCKGGRSHCPEEWIEPQQLLDGTRMLAQALVELDRQLSLSPSGR